MQNVRLVIIYCLINFPLSLTVKPNICKHLVVCFKGVICHFCENALKEEEKPREALRAKWHPDCFQ